MYGKSAINKINQTEAPSAPLEVLPSVGVGSIEEIPLLVNPEGYEPSGAPFEASTEPAAVAPDALPSVRKWIRETGAEFVAFARKGAITGELQAFVKLPV